MSESLIANRAQLSVRERIAQRLDGDELEDFAAILAWEDEILAFLNDVTGRADELTGWLEKIVDRLRKPNGVITNDWYYEAVGAVDALSRLALLPKDDDE